MQAVSSGLGVRVLGFRVYKLKGFLSVRRGGGGWEGRRGFWGWLRAVGALLSFFAFCLLVAFEGGLGRSP